VADAFWDRIHPILAEAMRAAGDEALWPRPAHRGDGPVPQLSGRDQLAIALWLCGLASPLVRGERTSFDDAVAGARDLYEGRLKANDFESYRRLQALAETLLQCRPREAPFEVARNAAAAARSLAKGGGSANDVQKFTRLAAASLVAALDGERRAIGELLDDLDNTILTRELAAMLTERGVTPSRPIVDVLHRPAAESAKKVPALFLVALADDGRYGLYVKLKTRWQWLEGGRDEVLASVPDSYFARAVAALAS
jgi:hypothetical protein